MFVGKKGLVLPSFGIVLHLDVCGAFEGLWRCIRFPKYKYNGGLCGDFVSLHPTLKIAEERISAVGYVVERLGEEKIPGIRNELYPVTSSFSAPILFSLEHVAAPYFRIKIRLRVHCEFCPGLVLLSYFVLTSSLLKHV
ncbi:hypothetical protein JHK87_000627 [Glycine soja]|nr:hypothetical protein JHK87_000627 [Glycine soja]